MVDTGCGVCDLNAFVKTLTDKPLSAVATVGYFGHAGGLHQFVDTAIHKDEIQRITDPNAYNTVWGKYMKETRFSQLPFKGFSAASYRGRPHNPTRLLSDGDVLDFGKRQVEVIHLPGITSGNIGLFEHRTGFLFTSDFLLDTEPLYVGEPPNETDHANVSDFIRSLDRVTTIPVTEVFPGHGSPYNASRLNIIIKKYYKALTKL